MPAPDVAKTSSQITYADVTESQPNNLGRLACLLSRISAIVTGGRTQAAFTSQWGRPCMMPVFTPQELWSRGCKRACVSLWHSPLLAWLLLAPKKKKKSFTSMRPSRSSRPTPASTSKNFRQGWLVSPAGPDIPALGRGLLLAGLARNFPTSMDVRPQTRGLAPC